jgi:hypothetical protein
VDTVVEQTDPAMLLPGKIKHGIPYNALHKVTQAMEVWKKLAKN